MIRLEIGLEIRHRGVMSLCAIEDKAVVVVVASYRSVSRNPVLFKVLRLPMALSDSALFCLRSLMLLEQLRHILKKTQRLAQNYSK